MFCVSITTKRWRSGLPLHLKATWMIRHLWFESPVYEGNLRK
jgi:hypothetical protein